MYPSIGIKREKTDIVTSLDVLIFYIPL